MKEIINNIQGVFIRTGYPYRSDLVSDLYILGYIGQEKDKENLRKDIASLLSDFKLSTEEAKKKYVNQS